MSTQRNRCADQKTWNVLSGFGFDGTWSFVTRLLFATALVISMPHAVRASSDAWPAEAVGAATNLTPVESPEPNDFYEDLSGVTWNPITRRLWLVRNGPGGASSKLWALREDDTGWIVDERNGQRAEWTGFGDLEDVALADYREDSVYLVIEGEERIKEYDVSTYGVAMLRNDWNTSPFLPLSGSSGAEGLTFVPDFYLESHGFVDKNNLPYTSLHGMGGLMFVGHQNGGAVFVFDLERGTGVFTFVGEYRTSFSETAALSFDRSTGFLYAWHDADFDTLEKCRLSSTAVAGQTYRRLDTVRVYDGPDHRNNEGIGVFPIEECRNGERSSFMTIDGGAESSLLSYKNFSDGCESLSAERIVSANGQSSEVNLTWTGGPFPYTLCRATDPGFKDRVVLVDQATSSSYADQAVLEGTIYFYRLE